MLILDIGEKNLERRFKVIRRKRTTSILLIILFMLMTCGFLNSIDAQVYSNKARASHEVDSTHIEQYDYVLPIWGKQAVAKGFDLPYSAGLGLNYIWQESSILINNLQVGINGGDKRNLDGTVRFNDAVATTNGLNIRPDIWLFPFLNIYGLVARVENSTAVDFGVWIPGESGDEQIFNYKTKAEFSGTSFGFGLTPTMGVRNGWLALDMNFTWTDIPELEKPAFAFVFGPRMGHTFQFAKPEMNLALWVGGFRLALSSSTSGSIKLEDILPNDRNLEERISNGFDRIEQRYQELDDWWNGLSPAEKRLNQSRYDRLNEALGKAHDFLTQFADAAQRLSSSAIQYSLSKRPQDYWNFIVGTQFQYNKHWMIRFEAGFYGSRTQVITGLQYRFGL